MHQINLYHLEYVFSGFCAYEDWEDVVGSYRNLDVDDPAIMSQCIASRCHELINQIAIDAQLREKIRRVLNYVLYLEECNLLDVCTVQKPMRRVSIREYILGIYENPYNILHRVPNDCLLIYRIFWSEQFNQEVEPLDLSMYTPIDNFNPLLEP